MERVMESDVGIACGAATRGICWQPAPADVVATTSCFGTVAGGCGIGPKRGIRKSFFGRGVAV